MTDLDRALVSLRADMNDDAAKSAYYDLFLNATFFVPTLTAEQAREMAPEAAEAGEALPLVVTADGQDYLMLFDSEARMRDWTKGVSPFAEVPGHVLATMSSPPLHWALNVGAEHSKQFFPDEIAWLRAVVEQCQAADAPDQEGRQASP
ncbi:MAG: SseB family protein [Desulfuromonadales bacterium]